MTRQRHPNQPITLVMRVVVLVLITGLWCLVLYMQVLIWSDWLMGGREYMGVSIPLVFSSAQILYGLAGTASALPFFVIAGERLREKESAR